MRVEAGAAARGEVAVLVAGAAAALPAAPPPDAPSLDDAIRAARGRGLGVRELSVEVARLTGVPRRVVYRRALELERGS